MSAALLEEPLSLELLQQELARTHAPLAAPRASSNEKRAQLLCQNVLSSSEKILMKREIPWTRQALTAHMDVVSDVFSTVQCILVLSSELLRGVEGNEDKQAASTGNTQAQTAEQLSCSLKEWTRCITHLKHVPHFHASSAVVRLPAILSTLRSFPAAQPWHGHFLNGAKATIELLVSASETFPAEVNQRCLPTRSLLPPWAALVTCAQYGWAWERLCALVEGHRDSDTYPSGGVTALTMGSHGAVFCEVQERLKQAHARQLSREVLLCSFDSINWKVGSAVPTVRSVAPAMWCLFQRCRSAALYGLTSREDGRRPTYFDNSVARRLTACVLLQAVNDIRSCLARNASDMHADRLEQLATRDIPCLALLTRLWYAYLRPHPAHLKELHASLVRLVNTAVELRNPLTVDESAIVVDADADKRSGEHAGHITEDAGVDDAVRATSFIKLVWNVKPLQEEEILLDSAGVPWCSSFPRAAAMEAVLDARVVVTTVE